MGSEDLQSRLNNAKQKGVFTALFFSFFLFNHLVYVRLRQMNLHKHEKEATPNHN